jgi:hypothetical protein
VGAIGTINRPVPAGGGTPAAAYVRNILDFGAAVGIGNATATRKALQAAHDSLAATGGTVYIPGSTGRYYIDGPVFHDAPSITFKGDGVTSRIEAGVRMDCPMFLVGMQRGGSAGGGPSANHWFDLFGRLDAAAVGAPGQKRGLRLRGDHTLCTGASPFTFCRGDFWQETRTVVIEWAMDYAQAPFANNPIMGMSRKAEPCPWVLYATNNRINLDFRTNNGTVEKGDYWGFNFAAPLGGAGVHHFAVQLDLPTGVATAFVDNVQVAVAGLHPALGTSRKFVSNRNRPFKIGTLGVFGPEQASEFYQTNGPLDMGLCGLRVSTALRYANDGAGQPQRRLDGGTVNDSRYFVSDAACLALLPLTDDPASPTIHSRLAAVTGSGNQGRSYLFWAQGSWHGRIYTYQPGYADLDLIMDNSQYGECLCIGGPTHLVAENVRGIGNMNHTVGSWNWAANYVNTYRNCTMSGRAAAFYTFWGVNSLINLRIPTSGKWAVWAEFSASVDLVGRCFCENAIAPDGFLRSSDASIVEAYHYQSDIEDGSQIPKVCAMFGSSSVTGNLGIGGRLKVGGASFGLLPAGRPVVLLEEDTPYDPPAEFEIAGVINSSETGSSSMVKADGKAWTGRVRSHNPPYFGPLEYGPAGGGIISVHDQHVAPPRSGRWYAGCHDVPVARPADGQYARWDCVADGSYGRATPPRWAGSNPADRGVKGLAAYMVGHSYLAVAGAPADGLGVYTDYALCRALNRILLGTASAAPPALSLALGDRPASRAMILQEPAGNGYARVGTTAATWAPSAGGLMANAQPITFGPATAPWVMAYGFGVAKELLIFEAATGQMLALARIADATVTAGQSVTLAPGAVVVGMAGGPQGWPASRWDAINEHYFRGAALAVPALYLALSTDPADPAAGPAEPAGNGYARVAVPAATWETALWTVMYPRRGWSWNKAAVAFAAATGAWATARSAYLMDAPAGGNRVCCGDLTIPRAYQAGDVPTFAAGALMVGLN